MDQFALHQFFVPSKDLTNQAALAHRRAVTAASPSLPHQAGKAFRRFQKLLISPPPRRVVVPHNARRRATQDYRVKVAGELRPNIDFERLARILIDIVDEREREKRAGKSDASDQSDRRPRGRS
ncbi:hypothetical protein [Microbacterium aquilitoris]|uniref:hypothetical protein n=1 Tax=Microbacterium aquilitoris TaxID=3067307 RepID=UPI00288F6348|nr:hypothetical protein [Microbacterium sp. KSW2-22]MDT3346074.1 hypothetical protein [Microbacterium sp. KSW2-22]